eukprot:COSAG06_NODE_6491_length_2911_cov_80.592105_2_plen_59_part_00
MNVVFDLHPNPQSFPLTVLDMKTWPSLDRRNLAARLSLAWSLPLVFDGIRRPHAHEDR